MTELLHRTYSNEVWEQVAEHIISKVELQALTG